MVTVTVSIDCLPLAAVMTSSPHCAVEPPYCDLLLDAGSPARRVGTVPVMVASLQLTPVSG